MSFQAQREILAAAQGNSPSCDEWAWKIVRRNNFMPIVAFRTAVIVLTSWEQSTLQQIKFLLAALVEMTKGGAIRAHLKAIK